MLIVEFTNLTSIVNLLIRARYLRCNSILARRLHDDLIVDLFHAR